MKSRTLLAAAVGMAFAVPHAQARITTVTIDNALSQNPAFGGHEIPGVGKYQKILGVACGELNPSDPKNAVIVDLELAGRNSAGNVPYCFDFYILKPVDPSKGSHKVMYEPPNRGRKTWDTFGRIPAGNDPGSITDGATLDNAFLLQRGYTMVWSGWDASAGKNATKKADSPTTISLPVAHYAPTADNPAGTITGPGYEYFTGNGTASLPLNYPPANAADKTTPRLTHRHHLDDTGTNVDVIPNANWNYNATGSAITLTSGTFAANDIYEFTYTVKDPTVNGIGFAAIRDFVAWLRFETQDEQSPPTANPLAGDIQRVYTEVVSQPGRLLNDFRNLGFNQAENGNQVFDGLMQWIAAGDGINMNYRFSQPGRTERNRQDHLYLEGRFPFANVYTHDPITGNTDSRLRACEQSNTCPRSVEIYSANEYWVKAASLLHTDPEGTRDLPESQYARNYFISSHQHGTGNPASRGACQQFQNPLNSAPIQRALWVALDQWVTSNIKPPDSRVPTFRDGTLVSPANTGFPTTIPDTLGFSPTGKVTYTGLKTTRYLFDYGLNFYQTGIATINPPVITYPLEDNPANGPIYPSYVPKTDSDGNDIAGVRLPDVTVPLATYTGWALRAGAQANDGCESSGQFIPFPKTDAARFATNPPDPRPSVAARYPTFDAYYPKVVAAIDDLIAQRLMLCEDAQSELNRLVALGGSLGVPAATHSVPTAESFPHCQMSRAGRSDHYK
jgi:Alpha/beta hydrolase domain